MRLLDHVARVQYVDVPLWRRINLIVARWRTPISVERHYSPPIASKNARKEWIRLIGCRCRSDFRRASYAAPVSRRSIANFLLHGGTPVQEALCAARTMSILLPRDSKLFGPLAVVTVLIAFWLAMLASLRGTSQTYDEGVHLTAGYTFWRYNDYRLNPENGNLPQRV